MLHHINCDEILAGRLKATDLPQGCDISESSCVSSQIKKRNMKECCGYTSHYQS